MWPRTFSFSLKSSVFLQQLVFDCLSLQKAASEAAGEIIDMFALCHVLKVQIRKCISALPLVRTVRDLTHLAQTAFSY